MTHASELEAEGARIVDIAVIGGGITGLACGLELADAGRDLVVLEASDEPGGVVRSVKMGDFLFEDGPHTVPGSSRNLRECAALAGLSGRLIASRTEADRRFLFLRGRLRALPTSPVGMLTTSVLSLRGKLRLLLEPLRRLEASEDEPSLEAFLTSRIGREATRNLAGAFVRGVYAAELDQLGAASAFPRVWERAHAAGGLLRGMVGGVRATRGEEREAAPGPDTGRRGLLSFPGGLGELCTGVVSALGERLHCGARVEELARGADGRWLLRAGSETWTARRVVLATPARTTADMLEELGVESGAPQALRDIDHAALTVVHLGLTQLDAVTPIDLPRGFGFLVPPDEPAGPRTPRVLGALFPHNLFEGRCPAGGAVATFIYAAEVAGDRSKDELAELALEDLERALGRRAHARVSALHVTRWSDVIPRYGVGHAARMQRLIAGLEVELPGLRLAGNFIGGVSVEDCLARGRRAARDSAAP